MAKVYSITKAKSIILDKLKDPNFILLGEQKEFLENLTFEIDKIEKKVRDSFHANINANDKVSTKVAQYKINIKSAHKACEDFTNATMKKIETFMQDPRNDKQFNAFLKSLLPHLEATLSVTQKAEKMANAVREDIYNIFQANGCYVIPMSQSNDPFIGSYKKLMGYESTGECDGYVKETSDEILLMGEPDSMPVAINKTNIYYEGQDTSDFISQAMRVKTIAFNANYLNGYEDFIRKSLEYIKKVPGHVYKIGMLGGGGHSTRIRHIPGTNMYEFYEPNLGTGYFREGDEEGFIKSWVTMMNYFYRISGTPFNKLFLIDMGELKVQDIVRPKVSFPKSKDDPSQSVFNLLFESRYALNSSLATNEITAKMAFAAMYELVNLLIPLVNDKKTLENIKDQVLQSDSIGEIKDTIPNSNNKQDLDKILEDMINQRIELLAEKQQGEKEIAEEKIATTKIVEKSLASSLEIKESSKVFHEEKAVDIFNRKCKDISLDMLNSISKVLDGFKSENEVYDSSFCKPIIDNIDAETKKMVTGLKAHFIFEVVFNYLNELNMMINNVKEKIPEHQSAKIVKKTQELFNQLSKIVEKDLNTFKDLQKIIPHEVLYLESQQRLKADKLALNAIITKMKNAPTAPKALQWFSETLHQKTGYDLSPRLALIRQLEELVQNKEIKTSADFEDAVHQINASLTTPIGYFPDLLDTFFTEYLGYKDYSRNLANLNEYRETEKIVSQGPSS